MEPDEQDFHEKMAAAYAQQKRTGSSPQRPELHACGNDDMWKNRYHVQAKLDDRLYLLLRNYCVTNDYSINTALKILLATHPTLSKSTNA